MHGLLVVERTLDGEVDGPTKRDQIGLGGIQDGGSQLLVFIHLRFTFGICKRRKRKDRLDLLKKLVGIAEKSIVVQKEKKGQRQQVTEKKVRSPVVMS